MLSRLILLLLCACLAVPAMASVPCHDGSAMAGMAMPHEAPAPASAPERKAIAVHACMGCIPPATLLRAGVAAPIAAEALLTAVRGTRFDAGRETPPATPPPRG